MEILNVLVLGATGRIGTILRKTWPDHAPGLQVTWQTRHRFSAAPVPDPGAQGRWLYLDPLADPQGLTAAARGADVILCLAGVTPAAAAAGADMADNSALARAAIRAAAQCAPQPDRHIKGAPAPRVLLASSAAVYGRDPGPLRDSEPPEALRPVAPYGQAKVQMEMDAQKLGVSLGVPVCALRIGNVAGVDAILGGWRPGFTLDRFADGRTPRRSYIGPHTLARVLAELVRARDLPPALNVATPGLLEMGALLDAAGLDWTPRDAPDSAIAQVQLSTSAIETVTSFSQVECSAQAMVAQWRALGPQD